MVGNSVILVDEHNLIESIFVQQIKIYLFYMKTTLGVFYKDQYIRKDGKWLIANRQSNFEWQESKELSQ